MKVLSTFRFKPFWFLVALFVCLAFGSSTKENTCTLIFVPVQSELKSAEFSLEYGDPPHQLKGKQKDGNIIFELKLDAYRKGKVVIRKRDTDGSFYGEFVDVILEPGRIIIDGTKGAAKPEYKGTSLQQQYGQWVKTMNAFNQGYFIKHGELVKAKAVKDSVLILNLYAELNRIEDSINGYKENYFRNNPQSVLTAMMLSDYVGPLWNHVDKAETLYTSLDKSLKLLPDVRPFERGLHIAQSLKPGKIFPSIELPSILNTNLSLYSLKADIVLIDFWASWCVPCRLQTPTLRAAWSKFHNRGFDIYSISFDQDKEAWAKAISADGYVWNNVIDTTGIGPNGLISSKFNIMAIPKNYLINKDGKILAVNVKEDQLLSLIDRYLTQ